MVLFFDQSSLGLPELYRAQTAALKFLRERMTGADLAAVMSYAREFAVLQDFTADRDRLTEVIESLTVETEDDAADDSGDDDTEFSLFNTDRKLAALESAARMLGALAERKALVYFTSGSGGMGIENESQLRATMNAAVRGNVSIYPVDARGLEAQAPLGDATAASPGGAGMYSADAVRQTAARISGQAETLYRLAQETGGKALLDTNDLSLGLRQAQKDLSSYYILGYYSSNPAEDGKYRRIQVQVNGKLAARLEYRVGYFARKQFQDFDESDRERQLEEALLLGDPITDLPIALEVNYFRTAGGRYFVPVSVKIPGREIALARRGGAGSARLDFIAQVRSEDGSVAGSVRENIQLKLEGDAAAQFALRNLQYDTGFTLSPGRYTLKFLTRENGSGKIGTFETKFVVPDAEAEEAYLPISSVVVGSQRENLTDQAVRAMAGHPLVQGGQKLIPSVTRVFRSEQQMYVYLEAYQPAAGTSHPITVRVGFYRDDVKAFESAPLRVKDGLNPLSQGLPLKFSVPLAKLTPGRYTCQVSVMDATAAKFAFWRAPILVLP
jgi:VWFA-related protein